tara:strand:- start:392 stop:931 length:540 start_codon:yes stop_codon:yes gene_type:complete
MRDKMAVHVLRIGHRLVRDDRATTHVCLVARAFGVEKIYIFDGDPKVKKTIKDVNLRWGGNFEVTIVDNWKHILSEWKKREGIIVHLTMYGLNLDEDMDEIRKTTGDILLVVGAKKVPSELYEESDFNIAVGNQPHSEVAALAVFLDRLFKGEEFKREFNHGKYRIVSSRKRKHLEKIR